MERERQPRARRIYSSSPLAALALSALLCFMTACNCGGGSKSGNNNPVPVISSLSPDHMNAGSSAFTLTVNGSGFISSSVANWNDSPRPTSFVNSAQLTASISQADVAAVGTAQVSVFNPSPEGGTSSRLTFSISGSGPSLTSLSPASRAAGGPAFILVANGNNFNSSTVLRWNGQDRATQFVNGSQVAASITSTDIAAAGIGKVTAFNPGAGGGESAVQIFPVFLNIATADLIYDEVNSPKNWIYASVPANAGPGAGSANTITAIDPVAGKVLDAPAPVSVGGDPGRLALSDDGQFLYFGLNQAPSVRRLSLSSDPPVLDPLTISLGSNPDLRVESLQVLQLSQGNSIAVARKVPGTPRNAGVAIYDGATQRPTTTAAGTSPNVIQLCATPNILFGLNVGDGGPPVFYKMSVNASGVTVTNTSNLISGSDISLGVSAAGERIFSTSGQVLDVTNLILEHTFQATGLVKADSTVGRVFYLSQDPAPSTWTVQVFDVDTFAPNGSLKIPGVNGNPGSLIRWGTNGLAFRTDSNQVFLITSP